MPVGVRVCQFSVYMLSFDELVSDWSGADGLRGSLQIHNNPNQDKVATEEE